MAGWGSGWGGLWEAYKHIYILLLLLRTYCCWLVVLLLLPGLSLIGPCFGWTWTKDSLSPLCWLLWCLLGIELVGLCCPWIFWPKDASTRRARILIQRQSLGRSIIITCRWVSSKGAHLATGNPLVLSGLRGRVVGQVGSPTKDLRIFINCNMQNGARLDGDGGALINNRERESLPWLFLVVVVVRASVPQLSPAVAPVATFTIAMAGASAGESEWASLTDNNSVLVIWTLWRWLNFGSCVQQGTYGAQDCGWQLPIIIYNHPSARSVHFCQTQMCNSSDLRKYGDDDEEDYFLHKTIIYVRNFLRRSERVCAATQCYQAGWLAGIRP